MVSPTSQQISQGDRIVVVMGPTGAGKSTFIEHATGRNEGTVSHSWKSRTEDFHSVRATHPSYKHPVVFVDTPGFDHTFKSEAEILTMITEWLMEIRNKNVLVTILYLHRISDNRMAGSAMRNLRLFSRICGKDAMPNVLIVTTMWSKVREEEGTERQEVLRQEVWGDILGEGFDVKRFEDTYNSAWNILECSMMKGSGVPFVQKVRPTKTEKVPKSLLRNIRRGFARLLSRSER